MLSTFGDYLYLSVLMSKFLSQKVLIRSLQRFAYLKKVVFLRLALTRCLRGSKLMFLQYFTIFFFYTCQYYSTKCESFFLGFHTVIKNNDQLCCLQYKETMSLTFQYVSERC